MQFTMSIEMDGAAFADDPAAELAACLERVAAKLDEGEDTRSGRVRDLNGNTCGEWAVAE